MSEPTTKINWLFFFAVLLAPAVVTAFAAAGSSDGNGVAAILAVASPLVGGLIAGFICGMYLAQGIGRTSAERLRLSFLFVGVFGCVSFILSFFACRWGGFPI